MLIQLVWWDLTPDDPSIETLRGQLSDDVMQTWRQVKNLRSKSWVADTQLHRWGALMVWSAPPSAEDMPPNIAAELIGRPPTSRLSFMIESECFSSELNIHPNGFTAFWP